MCWVKFNVLFLFVLFDFHVLHLYMDLTGLAAHLVLPLESPASYIFITPTWTNGPS